MAALIRGLRRPPRKILCQPQQFLSQQKTYATLRDLDCKIERVRVENVHMRESIEDTRKSLHSIRSSLDEYRTTTENSIRELRKDLFQLHKQTQDSLKVVRGEARTTTENSIRELRAELFQLHQQSQASLRVLGLDLVQVREASEAGYARLHNEIKSKWWVLVGASGTMFSVGVGAMLH